MAAVRMVWFAVVGALVWVAVGLCGASAALAAAPVFTPVPGSPFAAGPFAAGCCMGPVSVAFSPSGGLLATANGGDTSVSVLSVNTGGALTPVVGSPFAVGPLPNSVAFSPSGGLLAVANAGGNSVSVFSVGSAGALTPVAGSPFTVPWGPGSVAFSPSGGLLAVASVPGGSVSVFSVNSSTGALTPVAGSPFAVGAYPSSVAFSPSGGLLAVAGTNSSNGSSVSVFSVNPSTGALTPVTGSPFTAGPLPSSVAFSPSGELLAVVGASSSGGSVSVFSVNATTGALTPVTGSPFATGASLSSLAFSPSGGLLATANGSNPGSVSVFSVNPSTGALTPAVGSQFPTGPGPRSVAFSPSSRLLAVATIDGSISMFSVAPPPSAQITVSHLKAHADGTITFQVKVPGPGTIDVLQTAWDDNLAHTASVLQPAAHRFAVGRVHADATTAGVLDLKVSDNAQGKRLVQRHRYGVTLRLWVTYTPTGGSLTSVGFYGLHPGDRCPGRASNGERTKIACPD